MPLPRPGRLVVVTAAAALLLTPAAGAAAAAGPDPRGRYVPESGAAPSAPGLRAARVSPGSSAATSFTVDEQTVPVAPGLTHTRLDRYDALGWLRVNVLTADVGTPGLQLDYVNAGSVSSTATVGGMLARRPQAVAGVNGDFFDIGKTGAPFGVGVQRGRGLLHAPGGVTNHTFLLDAGQARVATTMLTATVQRAGGKPLQASNLNSPVVAAGGIGIYTPAWGAGARSRVVPAGQTRRQVVIRKGRVRSNGRTLGTGRIPAGATVLVGVGTGAKRLSSWKVGTKATVRYGLDTSAKVAMSGNAVLLRKGNLVSGDAALHPRTAIGVDATGRRIFVLAVDGRAAHSRGASHADLAQILKELGATDAINLDGGGSSTMMARPQGAALGTVNRPSDGRQRAVPNGLAFVMTKGSRALAGFRVEPTRPDPAADADRVLRGLTRTVAGRPFNGRFAAVQGTARWSAGAGATVRRRTGARTVVVGRATGPVTVTARQGTARGATALRVLGPPVRLEPSVGRVSFTGAGQSRYVELRGYDADGNGTWVEPRDVRAVASNGAVTVAPSGHGFVIRSRSGDAASAVTFSTGGVSTRLGTTAGRRVARAHAHDGPAGWRATARRASARVSALPDRAGRARRALGVDYTAARPRRGSVRAITVTRAPIAVPAATRELRTWVRSDGSGARIQVVVRPAAGGAVRRLTLTRRATWRGWRQLRVSVPTSVTRPVVTGYRILPTKRARHRAVIGLDDLASAVPWPARPLAALPLDRSVRLADGPTDTVRVALIGDAGVSASAPGSAAVAGLRTALRQARAAGVSQVVLTGDVVAAPTRANLVFARDLVAAELGSVPWRWVPGDRERSGDLATFRSVVGNPVGSLDRDGIRILTTDSSGGSFRAGGFQQLLSLRTGLAGAASADRIRGVLVVAHHAPRPLVPGAAGALPDRREAAVVEDVLGNAAAATGKPVALATGSGRRFQSARYDRVLGIATGPVAGAPAGPSAGSFTGWTLAEWTAQGVTTTAYALADTVTLTAPSTLAVGGRATAVGRIAQGGRSVPVAAPMARTWGGTRVHVGAAADAPRTAVVAVQPGSGALTALRRGTADLTLEVGGARTTRRITVD